MININLNDRVAIVTGGSAGIGRGISTGLALAGARVAVVARGRDRLDEAVNEIAGVGGEGRAVGIVGDVTQPADLEHIVSETVNHFGSLAIVVNNVGEPAHRPFTDSDDESWTYDIDLKLMSAVRLARLVVPYMKENGGGRIINILSTGARVQPTGSAPTSITRAAGLALTKLLANELAKDNVLVNAVILGSVKSEQHVRGWQRSGKGTLEEFYEKLARRIPLGRVCEPREVAELVAFLASDSASYMTGTAINFDGGMSPVI